MSEYKRLTNKDWKEHYDIFEDVCCDTCSEDCGQCERNFNALVRLAELEDKIENGTLVELPCKVGDTIYEVFKNHKPPFIQQTKVEKIIVTEKGLKLKLARNSSYETSISSLGKTLFLTEESAKAQIKKLQEKQKMKNNPSDAHA